jgi:anti-sigma-K factor RskA
VPVPVATTAPAPLVAAITPPDGAALVAVYDRGSAALRIAGADLAPPERSAELWAIGEDGVPHALGLLDGSGTLLVVAADDRGRLIAGATLAVSIEPIGGSPTGKPTGPVVATGALTII